MGIKRRTAAPKAFASSRPDKHDKRKKAKFEKEADLYSDDDARDFEEGVHEDPDVDLDDDEEIDEEMAFDEEDEEKFGSFFHGIMKKASEDVADEDVSDFEKDSDAVDLADLLESSNATPAVKKFFEGNNDEEGDEDDTDVDMAEILAQAENKKKPEKKSVRFEAYPESEFNVRPDNELSVDALLEAVDGAGFQSLKRQNQSLSKAANKHAAPAPLPPLMKDKVERQVAYEKSSEDITKWLPFVQQNRQADHLEFETKSKIPQVSSVNAINAKSRPFCLMEDQIAQVLKKAGVASEQQIMKSETLEMNKLDPEQLKAQQDELRRMRSLLFYAEIKQKRAAKIKSKKYRRIKKKERMKQLEKENGGDLNDEDRLAVEKKRAEERISLRHHTKRGGFKFNSVDEETRESVMDRIKLRDQLRKKIHDEDSNEDDYYGASDVDPEEQFHDLIKDLKNHETADMSKGVMGMKFMQKALEAKKNAALEKMEGMLGDDSDLLESKKKSDTSATGRMTFGGSAEISSKEDKHEDPLKHLEEPDLETEFYDREGENDSNPWLNESVAPLKKKAGSKTGPGHSSKSDHARAQKLEMKVQKQMKEQSFEEDGGKVIVLKSQENADIEEALTKAPSKNKISFEEQRDLIEMAFADDDVVREFEKEKTKAMQQDAPQSIDVTLPGWGAWSNQTRKNRVIEEKPGLDVEKRKDYKLKHVIINERKDKKFVEKYQVSRLPFPHKSKASYEAVQRMPVGKEWNPSHIYENLIKPRIITKPGTTIAPPKFVPQPKDSKKKFVKKQQ